MLCERTDGNRCIIAVIFAPDRGPASSYSQFVPYHDYDNDIRRLQVRTAFQNTRGQILASEGANGKFQSANRLFARGGRQTRRAGPVRRLQSICCLAAHGSPAVRVRLCRSLSKLASPPYPVGRLLGEVLSATTVNSRRADMETNSQPIVVVLADFKLNITTADKYRRSYAT